MRIYTRSGDKGTTSLIYGHRVPKNNPRVEAYGTCDEANSMIGLALSYLPGDCDWEGKDTFVEMMHHVQSVLFHVGAELATPSDKEVMWKLEEKHVTELEEEIDRMDAELPVLNNFILPSGIPASAALHTARTIVRRAERIAVQVMNEVPSTVVITYLNRLSDFLFVAARYVNSKCGGEELPLQVKN